jgi:hypothetical protein
MTSIEIEQYLVLSNITKNTANIFDQVTNIDQPTPPPEGCEVRYAITFGEVAILHIGGEEIGGGRRDRGFSVQELRDIASNIGPTAKVYSISSTLPKHLQCNKTEAAVLVIRNGASLIGGDGETIESPADSLLAEQNKVQYDQKYFDTRRQKTLNKRARYNIVFSAARVTNTDETNDIGNWAPDVAHSEDYRQCSVKSFGSLPHLAHFREGLPVIMGGDHASGLQAEGNLYYGKTSGIGYHGDSERKVVICLSLGKSSLLRYHWRPPGSSEHPFAPVDIEIGHGDVYVMSEKATGFDWRCRSKVRVVHAAGSKKYTT